MRRLVTWKRVAVLCVIGALAVSVVAWRLSSAPLIDCSPPSTEAPTVSVPDAALDQNDPYSDISIHGELVEVASSSDSAAFTVKDPDRGFLTFDLGLGLPVALDLTVGDDVTVTYARWYGTGSSGSDFALVDQGGLVLAVQDGMGSRGSHPPFEVTNVTAHCSGDKYEVPSMLVFSAAGTEARAAAGETATMSADGRDYLVHTFYATEVISDDVFDLAPSTIYVIARVPQ